MDEINQNIKSSEDIDYELEIAGSNLGFSPDEEKYTDSETEVEDEEDTEDLNNNDIKEKGLKSAGSKNQERTDERTYEENVKQIPEKDYTQNNETYEKHIDRNRLPKDSKLNPETETMVKTPDPDEPKKNGYNGAVRNDLSKRMKNKNQPL